MIITTSTITVVRSSCNSYSKIFTAHSLDLNLVYLELMLVILWLTVTVSITWSCSIIIMIYVSSDTNRPSMNLIGEIALSLW